MKIPEKLFSARAAIVMLAMMLTTATTAWAWQGSGTKPAKPGIYVHGGRKVVVR